MSAGTLVARLGQRRNTERQARRHQLLERDPQAFAAQLMRRAEALARKIDEVRR